MKGLTLTQAIKEIEEITHEKVTGIQYEDGSGYSFNYQIAGDHTWHYIYLR